MIENNKNYAIVIVVFIFLSNLVYFLHPAAIISQNNLYFVEVFYTIFGFVVIY